MSDLTVTITDPTGKTVLKVPLTEWINSTADVSQWRDKEQTPKEIDELEGFLKEMDEAEEKNWLKKRISRYMNRRYINLLRGGSTPNQAVRHLETRMSRYIYLTIGFVLGVFLTVVWF